MYELSVNVREGNSPPEMEKISMPDFVQLVMDSGHDLEIFHLWMSYCGQDEGWILIRINGREEFVIEVTGFKIQNLLADLAKVAKSIKHLELSILPSLQSEDELPVQVAMSTLIKSNMQIEHCTLFQDDATIITQFLLPQLPQSVIFLKMNSLVENLRSSLYNVSSKYKSRRITTFFLFFLFLSLYC